ncbi:hypothetical protein AOC36_08920 [Erysipelothrix larvae]|uniref:ABC3 transporter permease protein domain-containing protein n=1 Tax=Erysipelothrix larvae TaxID=1514105 RepID=A0A0X8H110_9FIRM|nr:ABC transporter permease [Erysipelothrix larvae]AMC94105.1 hypothetical protein AOC36_08920 [Erysipelothrix larvae]
MSYLFRAQAYVKRHWGRTLVIFGLLTIIANITLAALSVQKGSELAQDNLLNQAQSTVVYSQNQQAIMTARQDGTIAEGESVTKGLPTYGNYTLMSDSDLLSYSDATAVYEVTSESIDPYVNEDQANMPQGDSNMQNQMPDMGGHERPDGFVQGGYESSGDFTLNTFSNETPLSFYDETLTLNEGRYATTDEIESGALVVLINDTLASQNDLSVGDTITLTPTLEGYETEQSFEIIGIYTSSATQDSRFNFQLSSSLLTQNQMYVPFNSLKTIGLSDDEINSYSISTAEFVLADPQDADAFIEEASAKVDLTYSTFAANTSEYDRISSSLSSVSSMSTTMIVIILSASVAILTLIITLTINQRKNEIGLLLALGEKKSKIVLQLITETVMIASVAFILSCFTFSFFTSSITSFATSNSSSIRNIVNADSQPTRGGNMPSMGGGEMSGTGPSFNFGVGSQPNTQSEDVSSSIDASLTAQTLITFTLLGLFICVASTALPSAIVMRYNPKKILAQN